MSQKRTIIKEANPCKFCGAEKIFLKACTEGVGEKRFAVSLQCSKCHVHGPQVFSEWVQCGTRGIGDFTDIQEDIRNNLIAQATAKWNANPTINENTSDGYHTFKELYYYRMLYNAAFFNELAKQGKFNVVKSRKHSDGEPCFGGGWFIVVAELPTGQITNHYEEKDWDYFNLPVVETPPKWDGHTPQQAAERLAEYIRAQSKTRG